MTPTPPALIPAEIKLDELNERRDEQHDRRTERLFDLSGGDPSKLLEGRPCQDLQLASANALDEKAHFLADEADQEVFVIQEKLERIGPPEKDLFDELWVLLKEYRRHLIEVDAEDTNDDDIET